MPGGEVAGTSGRAGTAVNGAVAPNAGHLPVTASFRRCEVGMCTAKAGKTRPRAAAFLAVTDPQPVAAVSGLWRTAAQAATIGIFVILLIAALDMARPIAVAGGFRLRGDHDAGAAVGARRPAWRAAGADGDRAVAAGDRGVLRRHRAAVGAGGASGSARRRISAATSRRSCACSTSRSSALQDVRNALLPSDDGQSGFGIDIMSVSCSRRSASSRRRSAKSSFSSARCSSCCSAAAGCGT